MENADIQPILNVLEAMVGKLPQLGVLRATCCPSPEKLRIGVRKSHPASSLHLHGSPDCSFALEGNADGLVGGFAASDFLKASTSEEVESRFPQTPTLIAIQKKS